MDEAHHAASAGYAYAKVAKLLRCAGASCRILALSATAGADLGETQPRPSRDLGEICSPPWA